MLLPAAFLPVAIETGMIRKLDEEVLLMACRQNKVWQDAGYAPIRVSVNVSNSFFHGASLPNAIAKALQDVQLNPEYLELELTESITMRHVDTSIAMLQELRAMGVRLSIDDFGTWVFVAEPSAAIPLGHAQDRPIVCQRRHTELSQCIQLLAQLSLLPTV